MIDFVYDEMPLEFKLDAEIALRSTGFRRLIAAAKLKIEEQMTELDYTADPEKFQKGYTLLALRRETIVEFEEIINKALANHHQE